MLLLRLLLLLLESSEDDSVSDESLSLDVSELLSESDVSAAFNAACCAASSFGAFWRNVRMSSVTLPRPIDVKKLIANLVFFGFVIGNISAKAGRRSGVLNRSTSLTIPISSIISIMKILTKIREDDVVSSSFMCTT